VRSLSELIAKILLMMMMMVVSKTVTFEYIILQISDYSYCSDVTSIFVMY